MAKYKRPRGHSRCIVLEQERGNSNGSVQNAVTVHFSNSVFFFYIYGYIYISVSMVPPSQNTECKRRKSLESQFLQHKSTPLKLASHRLMQPCSTTTTSTLNFYRNSQTRQLHNVHSTLERDCRTARTILNSAEPWVTLHETNLPNLLCVQFLILFILKEEGG